MSPPAPVPHRGSGGWMLQAAAGYAATGMILGGIAGYLAGTKLLKPEYLRPLNAWLGFDLDLADGAILVSMAGVIAGAIIAAPAGVVINGLDRGLAHTRRERLHEAARNLGFQFEPATNAALPQKLASDYPQLGPGIDNVMRKSLPGVNLTVGTVYVTTTTTDHEDHLKTYTNTVAQTAALFELAALKLPWFSMRPSHALAEWAFMQMSLPDSMKDLNFDAHPAFSKAYLLHARDPGAVRKLFDDHLLRELGRRTGLCVATAPGSLLVYRPGQVCQAETLKSFIAEAIATFRSFEAAARRSGFA